MSLLEHVTPVILSYQEEPNIRRTLASVDWAGDVVVVDSGSADRTQEIARSFPNTRVFVRAFDNHLNQWRYAIEATKIGTPFVLTLDADMAVSPALRGELAALPDDVPWDGAAIPFDYRIRGRRAGGGLFPPQLHLVRKSAALITQHGHTQVIGCPGRTVRLRSPLVHDDRKPLEDFVRAQCRYSSLEWDTLAGGGGRRRLVDVIRRSGGLLGTVAACAYAALRIGLWWPSAARRRYWIERALFELLLAYRREDAALARGLADEEAPRKRDAAPDRAGSVAE